MCARSALQYIFMWKLGSLEPVAWTDHQFDPIGLGGALKLGNLQRPNPPVGHPNHGLVRESPPKMAFN